MAVTAMAIDPMETNSRLYPYYFGTWRSNSGTVNGVETLPTTNISTANTVAYSMVVAYQSSLKPNTFYHLRVKVQAGSTTTIPETLQTGLLDGSTDDIHTLMIPNNRPWIQRAQPNASVRQDEINIDYIESYVGSRSNYYFTRIDDKNAYIDAIFYFNDEFFTYGWNYDAGQARWMQCYLGIMFPWTGRITFQDFDIYEVGGNDVSGQLDRIIALLQQMQDEQGITQDDIKQAVTEAIQEEEQRQKQEAQSTQQQAQQAIQQYQDKMNRIWESMNSVDQLRNMQFDEYTITIGPFTNPMSGGTFPAASINLATTYMMIPQAFRQAVQTVFTFGAIFAVIKTFLRIMKHVMKTMSGEGDNE